MNSILPMPAVLGPRRRWQATATKATPEQRVRALLRFPFSPIVRDHTIRELLADPLTRPFVPSSLSPFPPFPPAARPLASAS